MRARLRDARWLRHVALLAVFCFVLMLAYALHKLGELQSELGRDVGENMVWALSQSVYQTSRLLRVAADEQAAPEELDRLRLMVLASVRLLGQGRQRDYMQRMGVWPELQRAFALLDAPQVDYVALQWRLQRIGGRVMVAERDEAGRRRDAHRWIVLQIMLASVGMLVAGMLLCCQLFLSLRQARAARQEISRQHGLAKALLETLRQERSVRLRYRDFVALMSHQLRTPLAVIDSSAQRLLRRDTDDIRDVDRRGQRIRHAVAQLNGLIERVLEGVRGGEDGQAAPGALRRTRCHWRAVVDEALERLGDTLGNRPIERRVEDIWIACDRMWSVEILVNLISNAHKYSPEGRPIRLTAVVEGDVLRCTVRDFGPGVAAAERQRIFERFQRGEHARHVAGSGLGLPIARMLACWQGGSLEVADGEGGGAAFSLLLPLAGQAAQRAPTLVE